MPLTPEEQAELQSLEAEMQSLEPIIRGAQGAARGQEMQTRAKQFGKPPASQRWTAEGNLEMIPGGKKTEAQQRMTLLAPESEQELEHVESLLNRESTDKPFALDVMGSGPKGKFDPTSNWHHPDNIASMINSIPYVGAAVAPVLRMFMNDDYRAYNDQMRGLMANQVYGKSGANMTFQEEQNAKMNFMPQPGDDDETAGNKLRNLQLAVRAQKAASEGRSLTPEEKDLRKAFKLPKLKGKGMSPEDADETVSAFQEMLDEQMNQGMIQR